MHNELTFRFRRNFWTLSGYLFTNQHNSKTQAGIYLSGSGTAGQAKELYGDNRCCTSNQIFESGTGCASMAYSVVRCLVPRADARGGLLSTGSALAARKDAAAP